VSEVQRDLLEKPGNNASFERGNELVMSSAHTLTLTLVDDTTQLP